MSILYLVSTPIGNLKDISIRALEVFKKADLILAEDTRKTGLLLGHFALPKKPMLSFFEANEAKRLPQVLNFLKQGKNIALVSNAGTPLISDPGFKLVRECIKQGIKVEPVPGASALLSALVVSGFPPDKFLFLGFLPKKQGKRRKLLEQVKKSQEIIKTTVIIYLSPYKLMKELGEIREIWGNIDIVLGRELTKIHQEIRREKISQSLTYFAKTKPKGEFVLVF